MAHSKFKLFRDPEWKVSRPKFGSRPTICGPLPWSISAVLTVIEHQRVRHGHVFFRRRWKQGPGSVGDVQRPRLGQFSQSCQLRSWARIQCGTSRKGDLLLR